MNHGNSNEHLQRLKTVRQMVKLIESFNVILKKVNEEIDVDELMEELKEELDMKIAQIESSSSDKQNMVFNFDFRHRLN